MYFANKDEYEKYNWKNDYKFTYSGNELNEAIQYYQKAVNLNPKESVYYSNIANCYRNLKGYDSAIDFYEKALKLKPEGNTYSMIGYCYYYKKWFPLAIFYYEAALKLNYQVPSTYHALGWCHTNNNNRYLGIDYFRKSAKLGNKDSQEYLNKQKISW